MPSTTARVACLMPIMTGFILAFKVDKRSRFAALLVITAAQLLKGICIATGRSGTPDSS